MFKASWAQLASVLPCLMCIATTASGQATSQQVQVRTIAEVELRLTKAGHAVVKLVPADRVVPGDELIYTLEVRNPGADTIRAPVVTKAVPEHMQYVARSAGGPGADVSYSLDGGVTYDRPENLKALGSDGQMHVARAADYTHIRWQFSKVLKPNSVAFARFRAVVK